MLDIRQAIAAQEKTIMDTTPPGRIEAEYDKLKTLQPDMKDFLGSINLVFQDKSMHGLVPPTGAKGEPFDFLSIGLDGPQGEAVDALITRAGIIFFSDGRMGSLPDPLPEGDDPPTIDEMVGEDWHHRMEAYLAAYPEGTGPIVKAVREYQTAFYDNVSANVGS